MQIVNKTARNAKTLKLHAGVACAHESAEFLYTARNSPPLKLAEVASTSEVTAPAQLAEVKKTSEDAPSSLNAEVDATSASFDDGELTAV
jgi:hypothetical protein